MKLAAVVLFAFLASAQTMHVDHVDASDTAYLAALSLRAKQADEALAKGLTEEREKYRLTEGEEFSDDFTHTIHRPAPQSVEQP